MASEQEGGIRMTKHVVASFLAIGVVFALPVSVSAHDGYSINGTCAITKNRTGSQIYFSNRIDKLADERGLPALPARFTLEFLRATARAGCDRPGQR
jgi:hypothetical protein